MSAGTRHSRAMQAELGQGQARWGGAGWGGRGRAMQSEAATHNKDVNRAPARDRKARQGRMVRDEAGRSRAGAQALSKQCVWWPARYLKTAIE